MSKLLIEVGAFDGSDSLGYYHGGYQVFTFEPHRIFSKNLQERTAHLSGYTVINKAVALTNGTTQFNVCKSGGASSILPFKSDDELNKHWGTHRTDVHYSGESYNVETTRLDTFIEEYGLQGRTIDYIHIDAQGVDLDVLKSLGRYISNVQQGVIETVFSFEKSIYEGQSNNLELCTVWLTENGFKVDKVENNDHTNCECNIYFSRA